MSSSVSGKFQDHYIILGVDPGADSATIQAAYDKLAQKYAGDKEKRETVQQAFEVLSDPELRASFDKVKGVDREGKPKFTGAGFFEALEQSAGLRSAILAILYDRMRVKSFKPSLSMRHLEGMLHVKGEALNFALWYLKKRQFVFNDDKSSLAITVEGMDFLEQNRPTAEMVMQFIRPDSVANPVNIPAKAVVEAAVVKAPVVETKVVEAAPVAEPVLNVLSRVLQRNNAAEETPPRVTLQFK
ncbi:MAG: J domain-containing protein [Bryobacteraceae bacterium]